MLEQKDTDLVLRLGDKDGERLLRIRDVFRRPDAFIGITSNGRETLIYIDGQIALRSPDSGFPTKIWLANSSWPTPLFSTRAGLAK